MKLWDDLDHRLSVIKRWGTTESIHKQSVAEHIFNVERMAVRLAARFFGIFDNERILEIVMCAHHHEDLEALSGDFPSMVKPYFDEKAMAKEHADVLNVVPEAPPYAKHIVKLADMFDSLWWLVIEHKLGNTYIAKHLEYEPGRIIEYVRTTWSGDANLLKAVNAAIEEMLEIVSIRHSRRGR